MPMVHHSYPRLHRLRSDSVPENGLFAAFSQDRLGGDKGEPPKPRNTPGLRLHDGHLEAAQGVFVKVLGKKQFFSMVCGKEFKGFQTVSPNHVRVRDENGSPRSGFFGVL